MRARRCCGVGAPCPVPFFVSAPKVDSGPALELDLASLHCVGATPHHVHAGSLFPIKRSRCEQRFGIQSLVCSVGLHCLVFPLPLFTGTAPVLLQRPLFTVTHGQIWKMCAFYTSFVAEINRTESTVCCAVYILFPQT